MLMRRIGLYLEDDVDYMLGFNCGEWCDKLLCPSAFGLPQRVERKRKQLPTPDTTDIQAYPSHGKFPGHIQFDPEALKIREPSQYDQSKVDQMVLEAAEDAQKNMDLEQVGPQEVSSRAAPESRVNPTYEEKFEAMC